ncbi:MAG: TlpA family protein disulfide reductase [Flavobacteriales bacterium]|nr:TlpA family protein disulfide reductase [Flavobacteriales bacterium]MEB2342118.1 TlpA disulfide reductase family protein [Flavobacteriia bacterium]
MRLAILLLIAGLAGLGCGHTAEDPASKASLATGPWRVVLDLDSTGASLGLPFLFEMDSSQGRWQMVVHNQDEAITVDSVFIDGDRIRIRMPFFDSEFLGTIRSDSLFDGVWVNHYKGPGYQLPFTAKAGTQPRFGRSQGPASADISGDWEVHFTENDGDEPAIGIFRAENGRVKGSFATEAGDLRFLDGVVTGDSLFLSAFNGSQAYLFRARIHGDRMDGEFRSGHRWKQPWHAVRNPDFKLADDERITTLNPGHPVNFSFPDTHGAVRSLTDERYLGKVVVLEIMGSWCPNCIDEARMLREFHRKYHDKGLETVAIAFEYKDDSTSAMPALRNFKRRLDLPYDLLFAGSNKRDSVAKKLPFIARLHAYPTTLLIGRDGQVKRIYTGIYGPGTGERYFRFRERMENSIVELLRDTVRVAALAR